jgi:hypothetical protein
MSKDLGLAGQSDSLPVLIRSAGQTPRKKDVAQHDILSPMDALIGWMEGVLRWLKLGMWLLLLLWVSLRCHYWHSVEQGPTVPLALCILRTTPVLVAGGSASSCATRPSEVFGF